MKKKICSFITRFGGTMGSIGTCCCYHDSKFNLCMVGLSAGRAGRSEDAEKGLMRHCIFRYADKLIHFYIDSKRNNFSR